MPEHQGLPAKAGLQTVSGRTATKVRLESIDILRGVVMILMALDHVRDFFGVSANPTDVVRASVPLFFTRWITHLCAPTFFLLTGTAACLAGRSRTKTSLSWFLFTRGIWLILLELTVVRCLGYQFNFDYRVTMLVILWSLGWSMIVLSGLVSFPIPIVVGVGVLLIALHNIADPIRPAAWGALAPVWSILHVPGVILNAPGHIVFVAYPLIPWVGVTAVGYGLGRAYAWSSDRRRVFLLRFGAALTVGFIALRWLNVYGDPVRWTHQASTTRTFLSFLNANKYPPSLLYLLMTLGPAVLFLRMVDGGTPRLLRPALVFGRVPLFYFLLHLPAIHLTAVAVCYLRYGTAHWMFQSSSLEQFPMTFPPGWGYSLPIVYLVWICLVVALYPLCVWFAGVRQRRSDAWLSYL